MVLKSEKAYAVLKKVAYLAKQKKYTLKKQAVICVLFYLVPGKNFTYFI